MHNQIIYRLADHSVVLILLFLVSLMFSMPALSQNTDNEGTTQLLQRVADGADKPVQLGRRLSLPVQLVGSGTGKCKFSLLLTSEKA